MKTEEVPGPAGGHSVGRDLATRRRALLDRLSIARAHNDLLVATDGRKYIDLFTGCGTVFLGHGNAAITEALHRQVDSVWSTGAVRTPQRANASKAIESFFPSDYALGGLYSTGMEAAEFALRVARVATQRHTVVGFAGCMHGKSLATAALGWENDFGSLPDVVRLPYVSEDAESNVLDSLGRTLEGSDVAAVFVEPFQGSSGGHMASKDFFRNLAGMCRLHGTLLVVDEILTGFHRTGPRFLFEHVGIAPDIVLAGKALGNGFPVSAVVVRRQHAIRPAMLPGSTYADNPLASAALVATLNQMRDTDIERSVAAIDAIFGEIFGPLGERGVQVRGMGAIRILEVPPDRVDDVVVRIIEDGVMVAPTAAYVRLLPPATILPERLRTACHIVRRAVEHRTDS